MVSANAKPCVIEQPNVCKCDIKGIYCVKNLFKKKLKWVLTDLPR